MKAYNAKDIRNIAIAGHSGRGKTTLAEAMLFLAKATDRLGRVADGNTVLDFDAEEKRRKVTIATAMAAFDWNNTKINAAVVSVSLACREIDIALDCVALHIGNDDGAYGSAVFLFKGSVFESL